MSEKLIVNFGSVNELSNWETVNDVVMGGISQSKFEITKNDTALFRGDLSLENSGGFASVRTYSRDYKLDGYKGLIIHAKGDGNIYRLRLKTDDKYEGIAYQVHFKTKLDKWTEVTLAFSEFKPFFRGQKVSDAPPLDVCRIRRIGLMIAEKQEGPFRLEIKDIRAYS